MLTATARASVKILMMSSRCAHSADTDDSVSSPVSYRDHLALTFEAGTALLIILNNNADYKTRVILPVERSRLQHGT